MYLSDIDDDDDGDAEDQVDNAADDNETSNASTNFKPQDLFGATPRVKAAMKLGMKSKYNKLIDSGDEEEARPTVKVKPKVPPKPRRREESSSSHAEEELSKDQAKPGTEFHYRELDDEYGSRPVAATSVPEKKKDHDVISIVSTSSQEYDAAGRNVAIVPNTNKTQTEQAEEEGEEEIVPPVPADPIIGHEHGVRPLLDDDELENAYGNQVHSKSVDMTDNPVTIDMTHSGTMSPDFGASKEGDDVFGAAPFRRKSKKKMSAPSLLSIPRPHHKDDTKLKKVSPIPLVSKVKDKGNNENQKKSDSQKLSSGQKQGDVHGQSSDASADMKTSLINTKDKSNEENEYVNDMFGSVPFVRRPPRSVEVLPTTVSPSYDMASGDKMESNDKQFRNSYSADSLSQKSNRNPADIFGSVPFGSMQGQYAVPRRDVTTKQSSRNESPHRSTPDTSVVYRKSIGIDEKDKSTQRFNENVQFSADYQRFEEESDSEDADIVSGERTKFTKSKGSKSPEVQNIEDSAFSNMSFNDFDEDEDQMNESFDRLTVSMPERSSHNMKYSQSQILNTASVPQPGSIKESNNIVNSASGEIVKPKPTPEKFDTFTWPRKRLKGHGLHKATTEPFSGKKKVDI